MNYLNYLNYLNYSNYLNYLSYLNYLNYFNYVNYLNYLNYFIYLNYFNYLHCLDGLWRGCISNIPPKYPGPERRVLFLIVSLLLSLDCFKFSSSPCILHSSLVSSFPLKFYSCNASLFLCCYRAHRSRFKPNLNRVTVLSQDQGLSLT